MEVKGCFPMECGSAGACSCTTAWPLCQPGPQIQLDVIIDTGISGILIFGAIRAGRGCSQGNFLSSPWPWILEVWAGQAG